jgi:hypothetical protein
LQYVLMVFGLMMRLYDLEYEVLENISEKVLLLVALILFKYID